MMISAFDSEVQSPLTEELRSDAIIAVVEALSLCIRDVETARLVAGELEELLEDSLETLRNCECEIPSLSTVPILAFNALPRIAPSQRRRAILNIANRLKFHRLDEDEGDFFAVYNAVKDIAASAGRCLVELKSREGRRHG
jgi:hypothetical protein